MNPYIWNCTDLVLLATLAFAGASKSPGSRVTGKLEWWFSGYRFPRQNVIGTYSEETAQQRPENFLDALSNPGQAVRLYSEGGANGPRQDPHRRLSCHNI